MGNLFSGVTDALGFTGQQTPNYIQPEKVDSFSSPFGTATSTGYTPMANPNQANVDLASQGLNRGLTSGFQASPDRIQSFQDAYLAERSPSLERDLARSGQQQAVQQSVRGTSGSSADLYNQSLERERADRERLNLRNQAIQGGENLANTYFNQGLSEANFYQGIGQQDYNNQLAGFQASQNALQGSQGSSLNYANSVNNIETNRVNAENAAQTAGMSNLIGAGLAGASLYNGLGFGGSATSSNVSAINAGLGY